MYAKAIADCNARVLADAKQLQQQVVQMQLGKPVSQHQMR